MYKDHSDHTVFSQFPITFFLSQYLQNNWTLFSVHQRKKSLPNIVERETSIKHMQFPIYWHKTKDRCRGKSV